MFTDLLNGEIVDDEGVPRRLTMDESVFFAILLASAGTETVARLIGWAGLVLAANPTQRAELAADHSLIPNAVEELLRFEAPSPVQGRWTTDEVELHGQVIRHDSKVRLITGAAGGTNGLFPDADRFDIHRRMDHHVSFGYGVHFCLGAALARLEGRIALEETLRRIPGVGRRRPRTRCSAAHQHSAGLHQPADHFLSGQPCPQGASDPVRYTGTSHPALVAQRTRASDYGSEGWGFESLRARSRKSRSGAVFSECRELSNAS